MSITKSSGVTATERLLAEFCERSFLKLWSYPNPFKDDRNELCDLLAVFGNRVFIFFDRESRLPDSTEKDPQVLWDRWKRNVIDRQVSTAHGAAHYIRSGRPIFLDAKSTAPFPLSIDRERIVVHKIIVAHGAKEACEKFSDANVYGSLGISYSDSDADSPFPFMVHVDKADPVHILDSHNLPIVFGELDTVADFAAYLDAKLEAISKFDFLSYCGEEDLLAHYLLNFDKEKKCHFIGTKDSNINGVLIGEGEWRDFIKLDLYKNTKKAAEVSYIWDDLLQRTCQNALDGRLMGNSDLLRGRSAIHEMAKEPRFVRRAICEHIVQAINDFPDTPGELIRKLSFFPSREKGNGYVFLQLRPQASIRAEESYREMRQHLLEIACGAAKNRMPELRNVIGIAIDAPKFFRDNSEDFILMPCDAWPDEMRKHYEEANKDLQFFRSLTLREHRRTVTEFVTAQPEVATDIGKKDPE
jgi:hypothetical protein